MVWINTAIIFLNTLVLLTICNTVFILYSKEILQSGSFPRSFVRHLDKCYQTFYSDNSENDGEVIYVAGDSYGAGLGDEFLEDDEDYGIVRKLARLTDARFVNFARGGYGTINGVNEVRFCHRMFAQSPLFPSIDQPLQVLLFFYEGNDIDNNLRHMANSQRDVTLEQFVAAETSGIDPWRVFRAHIPVFDLLKGAYKEAIGDLFPSHRVNRHGSEHGYNVIVLSDGSRFSFPVNPQAAAAAHSREAINLGLRLTVQSLNVLRSSFPQAKLTVVYLPSIVTSYGWTGPIRPQRTVYGEGPPMDEHKNTSNSKFIRERLESMLDSEGFEFVDTTDPVRELGSTKIIHGPRDWVHFNKLGYKQVARTVAAAIRNPVTRALGD
ncbi:hypothetical protein [Mesorhizobium sp. 10J20-29]